MVGVCKDDFRAELFEGFAAQALNGGLRANRHEKGRFDGAVRSSQAAATCSGICFENFEAETHEFSLAGV